MKRYLFILSVWAAFVFAGCERDKVSSLDNSVDAKINALIDGYVDDLVASEHGWIASIKTNKGYYRFWMDFHEDNVVEMYSDNTYYANDKAKIQPSTYTFRAFQRPTLVFDTYSYLSLLNDPDNNISHGSGNKGLETDFEFEVARYDRENGVFHMQGRFNKVNAIFRKASLQDKEGAARGEMTDKVRDVFSDVRWTTKYIRGTYNTTEIVVKLYDNRNMFLFLYNGRTGKGTDTFSYFNTEVDGTGDLYFPEPIVIDDVRITGVIFTKATLTEEDPEGLYEGNFTAFKTESHGAIALEVSSTPPDAVPVVDMLGLLTEDGKVYNALRTTGSIVTALGSGKTYSALNMFDRFLNYSQSFNILSSYDQVYYFWSEETPRGINYFMTMTMTPTGFGFGFEVGNSNVTIVTSYPTANYTFELSDFNPGSNVESDFSFRTANIVKFDNQGAIDYYNNNVTKEIIDGLRGRSFRVQWSEVPLNHGMVVELMPLDLGEEANNTDYFIPPAILTTR